MRTGVSVLVLNEKREILLTQRHDLRTWVFPGGRVEEGEELETTAQREVIESGASLPSSPYQNPPIFLEKNFRKTARLGKDVSLMISLYSKLVRLPLLGPRPHEVRKESLQRQAYGQAK